ncbi:MAG TPA: ABC transporter ATP-binding protein, partial [Candidatus Methylomirabilis sp.]|nr:ABC transporter ATP-binding protein [Candidatus Methylomirabilis sp.]
MRLLPGLDEMLIRADDLTKIYRMGPMEVRALRGVNLEVAHKEFVAIMGHSGSGKSTLLHLLGGLDRPTAGKYLLDGMEVESLRDSDLSRLRAKRIGFVFQAFNLIPQHNVLENIELPLIYGGVERRIRHESSLEILHQVGLGDKLYHRPTELSGGEAQRAAIARALVIRPLLLLADEPTGNLDSTTGEGIMKLFADLNRQGTTILVVTHNPVVAGYADRIIEMRDGEIV